MFRAVPSGFGEGRLIRHNVDPLDRSMNDVSRCILVRTGHQVILGERGASSTLPIDWSHSSWVWIL